MYQSIAALIMRLDLEPVDIVQSRDVDMVRDHSVAKPAREGKVVRVHVLKKRTINKEAIAGAESAI